jgi:hypothetical protein
MRSLGRTMEQFCGDRDDRAASDHESDRSVRLRFWNQLRISEARCRHRSRDRSRGRSRRRRRSPVLLERCRSLGALNDRHCGWGCPSLISPLARKRAAPPPGRPSSLGDPAPEPRRPSV